MDKETKLRIWIFIGGLFLIGLSYFLSGEWEIYFNGQGGWFTPLSIFGYYFDDFFISWSCGSNCVTGISVTDILIFISVPCLLGSTLLWNFIVYGLEGKNKTEVKR